MVLVFKIQGLLVLVSFIGISTIPLVLVPITIPMVFFIGIFSGIGIGIGTLVLVLRTLCNAFRAEVFK